jgi:3-oxoadipate enol-lactonase
MPFTENDSVKIYWDAQGEGAPILLIMGLGWPSASWYRTRPILNEHYRTIAFDNRGVGQSGVPPGPYSMAQMAGDAAAVLKAASVNTAHVLGVSMGGMIAQEFALQYPQKVRSLMLGCTAAGGPNAVQASPEIIEVLMSRGYDAVAFAAAINPFIYDERTPQARRDEDLAARRNWFPTPEGYFAQLQAIIGWEAYSRISQIQAPTLILHGEKDRLVPPENAKLIAERISGAKLVMIPRASHIFNTDQPEVAHRAILEFLASQATRKQERRPASVERQS